MLLSMTGYGKAEAIINNKKIHVEIKSLNSKNIDIQTHLASLYISKDLEIRSYLSQRLIRGKVDFSLWTEDLDASQTVTLNEDIIHAYVEQIKREREHRSAHRQLVGGIKQDARHITTTCSAGNNR